jgi:hypothetical protein
MTIPTAVGLQLERLWALLASRRRRHFSQKEHAKMKGITIRLPSALRCPHCSRVLRAWDIVADIDGLEKIICSGCHTLLLEVDRTTAEIKEATYAANC